MGFKYPRQRGTIIFYFIKRGVNTLFQPVSKVITVDITEGQAVKAERPGKRIGLIVVSREPLEAVS